MSDDARKRQECEIPPAQPSDTNEDPSIPPVVFRPGRGREQYLADIARCQSALGAGESYEVCLTDQIHTDAEPDPWTFVPRPAPLQPGAVRRLPEAGRGGGREQLARAFPVGRSRAQGDGAPDQGHRAALCRPGAGRGHAQRACRGRKDVCRAPDDRRPAAQRPGPGLRSRHGAGARADGDRAVHDRAPDDLQRGRHSGARPQRDRLLCAPAFRAAR